MLLDVQATWEAAYASFAAQLGVLGRLREERRILEADIERITGRPAS